MSIQVPSVQTPSQLNLAAFHPSTQTLGPGKRAAVWVQGCPFSCKGCIAPEWTEFKPGYLVAPEVLANLILKIPGIGGVTISGGEPMLQAEGLSKFVQQIKQEKDIDIICFTGYQLNTLISSPPNPGIERFLSQIDVLIDGQYVENLNDDLGLRGSSNQVIHHLTNRLIDYEFILGPRKVELHLRGQESFLIGIPPKRFYKTYNQALEKASSMEVDYEWA